jgi:AhpD family alkylhydroperoxidase
MKPGFDKRIFTPSVLLNDLGFLVVRSPWMLGVARDERVTRAMAEKIMNVTTAVNGCTYCAWYHARAAAAAGINADEVRNLFDLQFHADASEFEMMALLYAQHYAETDRAPDIEMTDRLLEVYGTRTARHVVLLIRMITFGNLLGNTWDAVLSRFKGRPAPNSNVAFELVFFLLTFWFMLPAMWLMKTHGQPTRTPETAVQPQRARSPVRRAATRVGSQTGENGGA